LCDEPNKRFCLFFVELNNFNWYNYYSNFYEDFTMNGLCVFLNSRVENSGALAWIGDKGLAPFRYLFNGATIRVQRRGSDNIIEIHHVASFHKSGNSHSSRTSTVLRSSSTGMIKAVLSIVLLIPGIIIGAAFKGLAYLSWSVRENHRLTKAHFTPIIRTIGSPDNPITSIKNLQKALKEEREADPINRLTDTLVIHGDGNLKINEDPGILRFNPMKLVLEGAQIVHNPSHFGRFDEAIMKTGNWKFAKSSVATIDIALTIQAPRRSRFSCKRFHVLVGVPKQ
jgi:hypothetical protein